MVESISTLGLQLISSQNLTSGQLQLSKLSQQLTTGKYSSNMAEYSSSSAQKLLNLTSKMSVKEGYLTAIDTLTPRLKGYDTALTGIEKTSATAYSTLLSSTTYDATKNASIASAIQGYIDDAVYYLNQQVGERYIFSGSRYDTAPVSDTATILSVTLPPSTTNTVASPAVPDYDVDYDSLNPAAAVDAAWAEDTATIDTTKDLAYGVTSTEEGFQQLILGFQWAYAATQDPANYQTYMETALGLISDAQANIRAVHTGVTNDYGTLTTTGSMIETTLSNMDVQIDNIEAVDTNEVSIKITLLQAQIEAAYAVTAKIINLSLLNYL